MLILNQLKDKKRFTTVELDAIDYLIKNTKEVLHMTAEEFAAVTHISPASISRLCQKLGVKGYKEFKVKLATEMNSFNISGERIREDIPFNKTDTQIEAINKILNLSYQALTDTYNNLDVEKLNRVAKMIIECNDLLIFGAGPSYLIAADFYYKMLRINKNMHLDSMPGFSYIRCISQKSNISAMFVTYYGKQQEHLKIAQMLHKRNIPIIIITGPEEGPLCNYADEIIHVSPQESMANKVGPFSSRTSMQLILDSLFSLIFLLQYDENVKIIDERDEIDWL